MIPVDRCVILAIESSCDESAIAIFDPAGGLAGEWVSSQIELHGRYGGVVPELAVREHLANVPLLLAEASRHPAWSRIGSVAVTTGPGLAGCLALGLAAAKSVAVGLNVPLAGINHLRAHAWSPFLPLHARDPGGFDARLGEMLPHLGLLVSGGNTALLRIESDRSIHSLGSTIDDAAGEALDKGAKLLGLGYPGGPAVEQMARSGNPNAHRFPRALPERGNLNFSFSGLKTSLRYRIDKMDADGIAQERPDLCASYQEAVMDVLVRKASFALDTAEFRSFGLSGGVANNSLLRERLAGLCAKNGIPFLPALAAHTGDNAGMIAFAAWVEPEEENRDCESWQWTIEPSLPLDRRAGRFK